MAEAEQARLNAEVERAAASTDSLPADSAADERGLGHEQSMPQVTMRSMLNLATELLKRKRSTVQLLRAA